MLKDLRRGPERLLSPQPCVKNGRSSQLAMAAARAPTRSVGRRPSDEPWGFDSLTFRLMTRPWPIGTRHQPSKLNRPVRFPQGALGDRLVVGFLALNQATEVRPLLPELALRQPCLDGQRDAESSNGRMRRSERLHVGSIPASAAQSRKPSGRMRSLS